MPERKRGAQPNNVNAVKHGRTRKQYREERRARLAEEVAERRRREADWAARAPKVDYAKHIAAIAATQATKH